MKILLTLILSAAAGSAFSQDTTGGTKAQLVIPLHKAKPKDVNTGSGSNRGNIKNMPGANGLPQKIDMVNPPQKKMKKHISKKSRPV